MSAHCRISKNAGLWCQPTRTAHWNPRRLHRDPLLILLPLGVGQGSTDEHSLEMEALSTTMASPSIIPSAVPTAGLENTRGQRNPSLLNLGAMVGMVMAKVVVIIPLYGWVIFLWWKQRLPTARISHQVSLHHTPCIPQSSMSSLWESELVAAGFSCESHSWITPTSAMGARIPSPWNQGPPVCLWA
nr:uncharacterized protein RGD1559588 isoform X9 [Rattus norvegicus]